MGKTLPTTKSGEVLVLEYAGNKRYKVQFLDTGNILECDASALRKGHIKDTSSKTSFGVGYIGEGDFKSSIGGKLTLEYVVWRNMLMRCYSEEVQLIWKTYVGCTVCEEWHNFQNFARWYNEQDNHHREGFNIDKDLMCVGNKVYCPEYCCLIPEELNLALVTKHRESVYPRKSGSYVVFGTSQEGGVASTNYLGSFKDKEDALRLSRKTKTEYIRSLVPIYSSVLPDRVIDAIMNYSVVSGES